jgi:Fusaric acid resistance protein-like
MTSPTPTPESVPDSTPIEEETHDETGVQIHVLPMRTENGQVEILKRPQNGSKGTCNDNDRDTSGDNENGSRSSQDEDEEELPTTSSCAGTSDDSCPTKAATSTKSPRRAHLRAFVRSLLAVDYTLISLVPGMRTAMIMMSALIIMGIRNRDSTAFCLGALYVGMTDPSGSWALRLESMGWTLVSVVLFGTLLPALTYGSIPGTLCAAFGVAFLYGIISFLDHPVLPLSFKLGTALFAIHRTVHAAYDGSTDIIQTVVMWTCAGGSCSLLAAVLPDLLLGNREAARTDLFQVWHGFGSTLKRWRAHFGTSDQVAFVAIPTITLSISRTTARMEQDPTLDATAKQWLLQIMEHADILRTTSLCLSNGYKLVVLQHQLEAAGNAAVIPGKRQQDEIMHDLFSALGRTMEDIGYAFQFPWLVQCFPCIRRRIIRRAERFYEAAAAVQPNNILESDVGVEVLHGITLKWLPPLVKVLQSKVQASLQMALDVKRWPPNSSLCSLPRGIFIPSEIPKMKEESVWVITGYAFRFAVAFSIAYIPEVFLARRMSEQWFPMTVALIMGPDFAATHGKVAHRTMGTFLGIGLGSLLSPLFRFPSVLIVLLGINIYAVIIFHQPNYALFTTFMTSVVFCLTVGTGASLGLIVLYRCLWTLAAAALVLCMSYTYPRGTEFHLTAKLAAFARAILVFANAVVEQDRLLLACNDCDNIGLAAESQALVTLELASQQVRQAGKDAIQKRLELLTCLHDNAILSPTEGHRLDPHFVAPQVAAALVKASVIPLFLALTQDETYSDLLSDLYDLTEMERLVRRLEEEAALVPSGWPKIMSTQISSDTICDNDGGPFAPGHCHSTSATR